jgi:hypothetical protein
MEIAARGGTPSPLSSSRHQNAVVSVGRAARNHGVAFILCLLLGFAFTLPGSLAPSSSLLGYPGDNFQHAWFLWHFARSVSHANNPFYTRLLFFPSRVTLAWSTTDALAGAIALPLSLGAGPVVAYNLSLVLQLALAAFFTRLLCLRIARNELAALFGGVVFGFSPFLLAHALGHLSLVTAFPIPLFLLALDRLFRSQNPSWRLGIPLGLALLLAAFAHYNYAVVCALFAFFWLIIELALNFVSEGFHLLARVWKPLAAGAATFLVGFSPLLWMMLGDRADIPVSRGPVHLDTFSAGVLGFLVPSWKHVFLGHFVSRLNPRLFSAGFEGTVYVGPIVLALAVVGFWKGRSSNPRWAVRAALLAAVFYLLSLGPNLRFLGQQTKIPGPAALFYLLPFARFMSAPARFHVVVALCLAILCSLGVKFLLARQTGRGQRYWIVSLLAALVIADYLTVPFPRSSIRDPGLPYSAADPQPTRTESCLLPPEVRRGTILAFPLVTAPYCLKSMWMQARDGGRYALVDGYLSYAPSRIWRRFWNVRILRSLFAIQGLVRSPIDVASDRASLPAAVRELNLSAVVVYDSPESATAVDYIQRVFGVEPQHLGTCAVFRIQAASLGATPLSTIAPDPVADHPATSFGGFQHGLACARVDSKNGDDGTHYVRNMAPSAEAGERKVLKRACRYALKEPGNQSEGGTSNVSR